MCKLNQRRSFTCVLFVNACSVHNQCQFAQWIHNRVGWHCLSWGNMSTDSPRCMHAHSHSPKCMHSHKQTWISSALHTHTHKCRQSGVCSSSCVHVKGNHYQERTCMAPPRHVDKTDRHMHAHAHTSLSFYKDKHFKIPFTRYFQQTHTHMHTNSLRRDPSDWRKSTWPLFKDIAHRHKPAWELWEAKTRRRTVTSVKHAMKSRENERGGRQDQHEEEEKRDWCQLTDKALWKRKNREAKIEEDDKKEQWRESKCEVKERVWLPHSTVT